MNEVATLPTPMPGYPLYYWDPSEYDGPRLGKLVVAYFHQHDTIRFVYERIMDSRHLKPGLKTFLAVSLDGIPGQLFETPSGYGVEPTMFNHERWQSILRMGSILKWTETRQGMTEGRWIFTDLDGRYMGIEYATPEYSDFHGG